MFLTFIILNFVYIVCNFYFRKATSFISVWLLSVNPLLIKYYYYYYYYHHCYHYYHSIVKGVENVGKRTLSDPMETGRRAKGPSVSTRVSSRDT